MALTPGTRLGVYEVTARIGEGGMGQVFRARDTRLNRDVALKFLPDAFASDPDRLARFTREAQTLASLNHPNIAAIYGLESQERLRPHRAESEPTRGEVSASARPRGGAPAPLEEVGPFLVMELVEGEDLSAVIARHRHSAPAGIEIEAALRIARQIAEALEAAHEQGIVHRDLKPANVKLKMRGAPPPRTEDGRLERRLSAADVADCTVKVLDFGLAKALDRPDRPDFPDQPGLSASPTMTSPAMLTGAGMLLGTAAYMSPEQARGSAVDKRADLWAFGVVLWEMLTGTRLFEGATVSDTLASVLKTEPDWNALAQATPPAIRRLLRRCLEKDRKRRLDSAADARLEIEEALTTPSAVSDGAAQPRSAPRAARLAWVVASVAVLAAAGLAIPAMRHLRETPAASDPVQFNIPPPENTRFGGPESGGTGTAAQVAVSPDGRLLVFVAAVEGSYQLWVRAIDAIAARPLPGTDDGAFPFWSPDSRSIGFFAGGKLKKVQVAGGPSLVLCDAPAGRGGTWSRDNVIVFAPGTGQALYRVSSAGGAPVPVSVLDTAYGESGHRWPHFLPDGRHFLYTGVVGTCCPASKPARVKIGALDATDTATLFDIESAAAYASGYLLFTRDGTLMAQSFDPGSRQLAGDGFPLAEGVDSEGSRYASFSVSGTGVLLYARGVADEARQLTWLDRTGKALGVIGEPATYRNLRLSPDDGTVAVEMIDGASQRSDVWILDSDGKQTRLTFDPGADTSPTWSPDGLRIAFQGNRQGVPTLRQRLVSGAVDEEELHKEGTLRLGTLTPTDWSADGRFLAFVRSQGVGGSRDIWVLPLSGDRKPFPFAQTATAEDSASFSPDGRWIAYEFIDLSAQSAVYVRPFPPGSGQFQISKNGGALPRWRADGKELFFLAPEGTMMAVDIDTTREFVAGVPRALFRRGALVSVPGRSYDVSKDGKRFLVNLPRELSTPAPLTVVVNWLATIRQ